MSKLDNILSQSNSNALKDMKQPAMKYKSKRFIFSWGLLRERKIKDFSPAKQDMAIIYHHENAMYIRGGFYWQGIKTMF